MNNLFYFLIIFVIIVIILYGLIIYKYLEQGSLLENNSLLLLKGLWDYKNDENYDICMNISDDVINMLVSDEKGELIYGEDIYFNSKKIKTDKNKIEVIYAINSDLGENVIINYYYDDILYINIDSKHLGKFKCITRYSDLS
jgi:hypothetical protein